MLSINALAPSVSVVGEGLICSLTRPIAVPAIKTDVKEVPTASNDSLCSLIVRELPKLKRLAWMLVRDSDHANDLVQDTVVRVLTYAHSWQPGTNFSAWTKTVMRNQFYTECAQRNREAKSIVPLDETHDEPIAAVQDDRLACGEISRTIEKLPRNQRVALTLAAFQGLNSDEIAVRMNITANAARCLLMRGRKQLRLLAGGERQSVSSDQDLIGNFG
jgi:RNA polymerase sigma-70 factor (ECF subfamily)